MAMIALLRSDAEKWTWLSPKLADFSRKLK
jgi:hypothetical protein